MMAKTEHLGIRIEKGQMEAIDRMADFLGLSRSGIVRNMIRAYLHIEGE